MTTEQIARMNAAIDKLDIEEGLEMELSPIKTIYCVKSYLQYQQFIVNLDCPGSIPAFNRIVEVMRKLK